MSPQGGIKAIDTSPASSSVVATAGGDGVVAVYDSAAGRLLSELRGHTKKVNGELFAS
jgi:WD40 repeat protein